MIGFFVNQLVLRTNMSGDPTFKELLRRVRETTLEAYTHQDLPFDKLVEVLNPGRDLSRAPLFQVKIIIQNLPREILKISDLELSRLSQEAGVARFDLVFNISDTREGVVGTVEYNTDLFDASTIKRMVSHFRALLESEVDRTFGAVQFESPLGPGFPFSSRQLRQELDFRERTLNVTFNQLLSDEWSVGARYRLSNAELDSRFPEISSTVPQLGGFEAEQNLEATLHQVNLFVLYNHPSGFFGGANTIWTRQSNHGYSPDIPGDDFWQFNVEAGWRFFRRRVEARVALLNLTDQDYKLNSLNLTRELPRERTLALSLGFNF
jgi:hypothetical protein